MSRLRPAHRWLAFVILAGALAACSAETTAPTGPVDQAALTQSVNSIAPSRRVQEPVPSFPIGVRLPCDNPLSERFCPVLP